jgi:hypothetical protein
MHNFWNICYHISSIVINNNSFLLEDYKNLQNEM